MAYRLLCAASAFLISLSISSVEGETIYVNMCQLGTTPINEDNLVLDAVGPQRNQLAANTSKTCSCSISVTPSTSRPVYVQFLRQSQQGDVGLCSRNEYDNATLDFTSNPPTQSLTLQKNNLSNFNENYYRLSAIKINITISSICGSNYTIHFEKISMYKLSHVTCSNPKTVDTNPFTTASPATLKPARTSENDMVSTYSPRENSSASSVVEKNVLTPQQIGLIVGVVVGVGGLILIVAVILVVLVFRRRRTKPQPLTNASQNAPTVNSYEPPVEYASISYEELRNSAQLQTDILYDNQPATTDPFDTESGQNCYNLQGNVNSLYHHSDAAFISDQTTSSEVDNFVQDPHSINDTDTTVIENDLYEK